MKSKRAAIGNLISNYFSLIFLAIILGLFIVTAPLIKIAVGNIGGSDKGDLNLEGYALLFQKLNEERTNYLLDSEPMNINSIMVSPNQLPNSNQIYFFFNGKNELLISINSESCFISDISVGCSKYDKDGCLEYILQSTICQNFDGKEITPLIANDLGKLKGKTDYELQLDYLKNQDYSWEVFSYE